LIRLPMAAIGLIFLSVFRDICGEFLLSWGGSQCAKTSRWSDGSAAERLHKLLKEYFSGMHWRQYFLSHRVHPLW
jgi:hypothetical protein